MSENTCGVADDVCALIEPMRQFTEVVWKNVSFHCVEVDVGSSGASPEEYKKSGLLLGTILCVSREGGLGPCAAMFDSGYTLCVSFRVLLDVFPTFYVKVVPNPEVDLVFLA